MPSAAVALSRTSERGLLRRWLLSVSDNPLLDVLQRNVSVTIKFTIRNSKVMNSAKQTVRLRLLVRYRMLITCSTLLYDLLHIKTNTTGTARPNTSQTTTDTYT